VVIEYGIPEPLEGPPGFGPGDFDTSGAEIVVSSAVVQSESELDVNGAPLLVRHAYQDFSAQATHLVDQVVRVQKMEPQLIVRVRRRENQAPGNLAKQYVGTVNALGVFGDPPTPQMGRQWLCTGISGESRDGGFTYDVSYEFAHRKTVTRMVFGVELTQRGWDALIQFRDPETQEPFPVAVVGEDLKTYQMYPERDFYQMGI
jgi:hypothetical protein